MSPTTHCPAVFEDKLALPKHSYISHKNIKQTRWSFSKQQVLLAMPINKTNFARAKKNSRRKHTPSLE